MTASEQKRFWQPHEDPDRSGGRDRSRRSICSAGRRRRRAASSPPSTSRRCTCVNVAVLATVGWLLRHGVRSTTLVMTFVWPRRTPSSTATWSRTRCSSAGKAARLLGSGGLLASLDLAIPGLTTWTRPTVHLVWNVGEVLLLVLAYVGFAWPCCRERAVVRSPDPARWPQRWRRSSSRSRQRVPNSP